MRPGTNAELTAALAAAGITTALCARLEFQSETLFVWTGAHPIQPTGKGDALLDGNTFHPLVNGVMVDVGENAFSYSGSAELPITINVPSAPPIAIAAAQTFPAEYQGRTAILWRAVKIVGNDPLAPPAWLFRRIRSGTMDKVEVVADGQSHRITLTIESHQGKVSNASNQTYLDQRKYDPNDSSQDFAASIANGDPAPAKGSAGSGGVGYGSVDFDARSYRLRNLGLE